LFVPQMNGNGETFNWNHKFSRGFLCQRNLSCGVCLLNGHTPFCYPPSKEFLCCHLVLQPSRVQLVPGMDCTF